MPSLLDMFIGNHAGSIGETSALALIAGGIYLLARRVISWRIPVSFIGMVALIALLTGDLTNFPYYLLAGGLMIGAFFMATDYVTSPVSPRAQIVFGLGLRRDHDGDPPFRRVSRGRFFRYFIYESYIASSGQGVLRPVF